MKHEFLCAIRRFCKENSGAALVEFAIALPLLLLMLAVIVEGSRITWIHQAAAAGVRDATRYFARTQSALICENAANVSAFNNSTTVRDAAQDIVTERVGSPGQSILPGGVRDIQVSPVMACTTVNYPSSAAAVVPKVGVDVTLTIDFPFGGVFRFFSGSELAPLTTTIGDETRVFGT